MNGEPVEEPVPRRINAYLVDGANVLVKKRTKPLAHIPPALRGSQPTEGGNLIVESKEYEEVAADPIAAKYLRPFRMGRELIRGLDRWCLWMADDDFDPADINRSPVLKERVAANQAYRENAPRSGDAYKLKDIPHLFRPNKNRPLVPYVGIPAVVSESRKFYTAAHLADTVIAGNKLFTAEDPDGLLFGLISSSMFITWQKTVGGRLKSDLNFSNTMVWNNFPVPDMTEQDQAAIINGGKAVLEARAKFPTRSLADHYSPLAMGTDLLKAHAKLDRAVDKAFGATRKRSLPGVCEPGGDKNTC